MRSTRVQVLVLILALPLGLAGCGGGGGGGGGGTPPPVTPSLLSGTHDYFAIASDMGPPLEVEGQWGSLTSDGVSAITTSATVNRNGTLSGPSMSMLFYSLAANRTLEWTFGGPAVTRGGISADGNLATMGTVLAGSFPALVIHGKRAAVVHSNASLTGTYHFLGFVHDGAPSSLGLYGTVTFDGAGGAMVSYSGNAAGTIMGPIAEASTYSVAANGTFTWTFSFGQMEQGAILAGGALAVMAGGTLPGDAPALFVLVRRGAGLSTATLSGTYFMAGIELDLGGGTHQSSTGTLVANGAGSATVTFTQNDGTVITNDPPVAVPYAVAADGTLTVTPGGGDTFTGGVVAGGAFFVLGGGTTAGTNPLLYFGLR